MRIYKDTTLAKTSLGLSQVGIGNPYGKTIRLSWGGYHKPLWVGFGWKGGNMIDPYFALGIVSWTRFRGIALHINCWKLALSFVWKGN